jgi:hypothetical protein
MGFVMIYINAAAGILFSIVKIVNAGASFTLVVARIYVAGLRTLVAVTNFLFAEAGMRREVRGIESLECIHLGGPR